MPRKLKHGFWKAGRYTDTDWERDGEPGYGNPCEVRGCLDSRNTRFIYQREVCLTHYVALNCICGHMGGPESSNGLPCYANHTMLDTMRNNNNKPTVRGVPYKGWHE